MRVGKIPEIRIGNMTAEVSTSRLYRAAAISNALIIDYATIKRRNFTLAAQVCEESSSIAILDPT